MVETRKDLRNCNLLYGQLIIGPPGSGKSTYSSKMSEFLSKLDRKVEVVNLDPANENIEYKPNIDIMKLITVEDVMDYLHLGPNGALVYCMEYLEKNFNWLLNKLKESTSNYFIFDCPGQVELYTHHGSMANIFSKLQLLGYQLCTVHLIDSHYCSEPSKFISTLILSLNTMLQMGLPHINVLSKADLFKEFENRLLFSLDYYTDVLDLNYLLDALDETPGMKKYKKLNAALISLIEDYSLVTFHPLDIKNDNSLLRLKKLIDNANGFVFGASEEMSINSLLSKVLVGSEPEVDRMENDINPYLY